ncbi:SAM-dependent methyltransferase [Halobacteriovorax sp. YZS-1-1]|uniref:SAM-dependent methyltransferase n=1 Tax=unclassified Halobacteriovorax TaxID=2639665 RepID=UPI00399C00B2
MNDFYLFFYHEKLKDLLLEEIKLKHPKLRLSFSNKEFISMKGPSSYEEQLTSNPLIFARRQAVFNEKSQEKPCAGEFVAVSENQFWSYRTISTSLDTFDIEEVELAQEVPARAYHKINQAFTLFNIELSSDDQVIEVGSAPGGISYYVLERGAKLVSIDPAKMDPIISEKFGNSFEHIKKSVFDITRTQLPKHCDWLISDLNLNGDLNTNQSRRIMDFYKDIKGGFLTIKTPVLSDLEKIDLWVKNFSDKYDVTVFHLPSHRREIGFMIRPLNK